MCGGGEEVGRIREEFEPQRQMRVPEKKRTDENGEEKKTQTGVQLHIRKQEPVSETIIVLELIYACIFISLYIIAQIEYFPYIYCLSALLVYLVN